MTLVKCDRCGEEYGIGEFPFCPHGEPTLVVDNFMPRHDEHLSSDGLTYTSYREKVKYMDQHGITEKRNPHESRIARGATGQSLFFDMRKK